MRYLITGAAGFVGSRLARRLIELGEEATCTFLGPAPGLAGARLREVDLRDAATLKEVVAEADPEVIVHLAGLSHVGGSWQAVADYFQVNVLGTENLLEAAAGRRLVMASSAEVYGLVPEAEQPIGEGREPAPQNPYAMSKAAAERLVLPRGGIAVRSFSIVGAGQAPNFALPAFAAQLAAIEAGDREPVLAVGNLEARRDFVHVDDAVDAYVTVAAEGRPGEVYNLGSGVTRSIAEMLERLVGASGVAARTEVDPQRLRPLDLPLLAADAGRLRGLGWAPERRIDDALAELWDEASRRRRQAS